ncbi:MAG TPA: hypothetical protein VKC60_15905 [Opitutaceae bacterium]|nr:hypothetical protein [Opitutaceae bacterium]
MKTRCRIWVPLALALVPVITFGASYYTIFENKREGTLGYNSWIVFGSPVFVGVVVASLFHLIDDEQNTRQRMLGRVGIGITVAAVFWYALFFVILNTLGS